MNSTNQSNKNRLLNFPWKIFYGWWIVVLTLIITSSTSSPAVAAVGVWVASLEEHFGWSRTQLALAFSLGQLEASVAGPIVGILVDKIGAKKLIFAGIALVGIGFILLSQTNSLIMFYISYGVVMLGASGGGWLPMMTVINNWFDKKMMKNIKEKIIPDFENMFKDLSNKGYINKSLNGVKPNI